MIFQYHLKLKAKTQHTQYVIIPLYNTTVVHIS